MEKMSYVFSFTFFFTAAHFLLALVAAGISHFVTAATKFSQMGRLPHCLTYGAPLYALRARQLRFKLDN